MRLEVRQPAYHSCYQPSKSQVSPITLGYFTNLQNPKSSCVHIPCASSSKSKAVRNFGASSSSSMFSSCRRSRRSFKASSRTLWQRQQRWKILRLRGWPSHPNEKDLMKWHEMMCFTDFLHASSHKKPEFGPLKHKAWPWQHHAWCYWTVAKGSPAKVWGDSRVFRPFKSFAQTKKVKRKQNEWEWKG